MPDIAMQILIADEPPYLPFQHCPLEEKGPGSDASALPDRVLIFRDNLCLMCESRAELIDEIRITVLHEIGHHFGLDEDHLADLGYG